VSSTLKIAGSVGVVALLVGYVGGLLPERARRMAAETQVASHQAEVASIRQELTSAEGRIRVGVLLGRALMVKDLAAGSDYGRAQQVSSEFFDAVRAESTATEDAARRAVLMSVLARRDAVTAAMAKAEPAVVSTLTQVERELRRALNYPVAEAATEGVAPPRRP
jgi:hypothetical protein